MGGIERRQAVRWALITVAVTLALFLGRSRLDKAHVALAYLLLVLGGSAQAGQRVGLALSAATFLLFDWFFLQPYGTLTISNPLDWMILASFLAVSVVAARLLNRLQDEAKTARQRAADIDRFATLGAETQHSGKPPCRSPGPLGGGERPRGPQAGRSDHPPDRD